MYEPSDDSFLLIDSVIKLGLKGEAALEMGCGSGIVSTELKKRFKEVLAVDIDLESVKHCRNLKINAIVSDLFSKVKGKFDLIVFNPPYLPCSYDEDRENCCGDGKIIERFVKDAPGFLKKNGKILLLLSSLTPYKAKGTVVMEKKLHFETLSVYQLDI